MPVAAYTAPRAVSVPLANLAYACTRSLRVRRDAPVSRITAHALAEAKQVFHNRLDN